MFETALANADEVYNFYSSGDEVLEADAAVPGVVSNVMYVQWPDVSFSWRWPFIRIGQFDFQTTFERNAWQKQEVLKGVNPYLTTLEGGWGFHTWEELDEYNELVPTTYTASDAAAMVADGSIVTNAVFNRSVAAMFSPSSTTNEIYHAMAYCIPAVSFAAGNVEVPTEHFERNIDLNTDVAYRSQMWGRTSAAYGQRWLHSDMKDMAYCYVFRLYHVLKEIIQGE